MYASDLFFCQCCSNTHGSNSFLSSLCYPSQWMLSMRCDQKLQGQRRARRGHICESSHRHRVTLLMQNTTAASWRTTNNKLWAVLRWQVEFSNDNVPAQSVLETCEFPAGDKAVSPHTHTPLAGFGSLSFLSVPQNELWSLGCSNEPTLQVHGDTAKCASTGGHKKLKCNPDVDDDQVMKFGILQAVLYSQHKCLSTGSRTDQNW